LAFDSSGDLYVANFATVASNVTVYAPGSTKVLRTISQGVSDPSALTIGPSDYLYVANTDPASPASTVTEYAPGKTSPVRTIFLGVSDPWALAIGP
jgi:hypothetical protein